MRQSPRSAALPPNHRQTERRHASSLHWPRPFLATRRKQKSRTRQRRSRGTGTAQESTRQAARGDADAKSSPSWSCRLPEASSGRVAQRERNTPRRAPRQVAGSHPLVLFLLVMENAWAHPLLPHLSSRGGNPTAPLAVPMTGRSPARRSPPSPVRSSGARRAPWALLLLSVRRRGRLGGEPRGCNGHTTAREPKLRDCGLNFPRNTGDMQGVSYDRTSDTLPGERRSPPSAGQTMRRMHMFKTLWRDEEGLTTVEYALLLALVSIAAITAWSTLGSRASGTVAKGDEQSADELVSTQAVPLPAGRMHRRQGWGRGDGFHPGAHRPPRSDRLFAVPFTYGCDNGSRRPSRPCWSRWCVLLPEAGGGPARGATSGDPASPCACHSATRAGARASDASTPPRAARRDRPLQPHLPLSPIPHGSRFCADVTGLLSGRCHVLGTILRIGGGNIELRPVVHGTGHASRAQHPPPKSDIACPITPTSKEGDQHDQGALEGRGGVWRLWSTRSCWLSCRSQPSRLGATWAAGSAAPSRESRAICPVADSCGWAGADDA